MHRLVRWVSSLATASLIAVTVTVATTGSAASAVPLNNSVTATTLIFNCPTGVSGCAAQQRRQGDARVGDPLTDVCRADTQSFNLVYNRTTRVGAAQRTGFLARSALRSSNQGDSCVSGGHPDNTSSVTNQLLCPFTTCGSTGVISRSTNLRDLCFVIISGVEWRLTVALNSTGGQQTAGFIPLAELNNGGLQQNDCASPR